MQLLPRHVSIFTFLSGIDNTELQAASCAATAQGPHVRTAPPARSTASMSPPPKRRGGQARPPREAVPRRPPTLCAWMVVLIMPQRLIVHLAPCSPRTSSPPKPPRCTPYTHVMSLDTLDVFSFQPPAPAPRYLPDPDLLRSEYYSRARSPRRRQTSSEDWSGAEKGMNRIRITARLLRPIFSHTLKAFWPLARPPPPPPK